MGGFTSSPSEITIIKKTTDQTVNNSETLVDDTELVFNISAGKVYGLKINLYYNVNALADMDIKMVLPAAAAFYGNIETPLNGNSAITDAEFKINCGGESFALIDGILKNPTNAGTFQFQFAQNSAHASDCTIYKGSSIEYWEVV
jgi:hypothetical protein